MITGTKRIVIPCEAVFDVTPHDIEAGVLDSFLWGNVVFRQTDPDGHRQRQRLPERCHAGAPRRAEGNRR